MRFWPQNISNAHVLQSGLLVKHEIIYFRKPTNHLNPRFMSITENHVISNKQVELI